MTNRLGIDSLLAEEKVTSSDYAAIKALVTGDIDSWMGFKFIEVGDYFWDTIINDVGGAGTSGDPRNLIAMSMKGVSFGNADEVHTSIVPRPDKWDNALQASGYFSAGAVRADDKRIVKIQVVDS